MPLTDQSRYFTLLGAALRETDDAEVAVAAADLAFEASLGNVHGIEDFEGEDLPDSQVDEALWEAVRGLVANARMDQGLPQLLGTFEELKILLVDGNRARTDLSMDFNSAGNGYGWETGFIPKDEVWLDSASVPSEWPFDLYHEMHEIRLMRGGMGYDEAHAYANAAERTLRLRAQGRGDEASPMVGATSDTSAQSSLLPGGAQDLQAEFGYVTHPQFGRVWAGASPPGGAQNWQSVGKGPRGGQFWKRAEGYQRQLPQKQQQAAREQAGSQMQEPKQRPEPKKVAEEVKQIVRRGVQPEDVAALRDTLLSMTVKDILAFKKDFGLKASGPKADLAKKVAQRVKEQAARILKEQGMQVYPEAQKPQQQKTNGAAAPLPSPKPPQTPKQAAEKVTPPKAPKPPEQKKSPATEEWKAPDNPAIRPVTEFTAAGHSADELSGAFAKTLAGANHLSPQQKKDYQAAADNVFKAMPDAARKLVNENLKVIVFHESIEALSDERLARYERIGDEEGAMRMRGLIADGQFVGGSFGKKFGKLTVNGPIRMSSVGGPGAGSTNSIENTYAHELTHAIDGKHGALLSATPEWETVWKEEIVAGAALSEYGESSAREGFAEFGRALYTGADPKKLRELLPRASAFFEKHGFMEKENAIGQQPGQEAKTPAGTVQSQSGGGGRGDSGRAAATEPAGAGAGAGKPSAGSAANKPVAPVKQIPKNQGDILSKVRRETRDRDSADAMRELSNVSLKDRLDDPIFGGSPGSFKKNKAVFDQFDAHATTTLSSLETLLNGGIATDRDFFTSPLSGSGTEAGGYGTTIRDSASSFVVLGHPGKTLKEGGIAAVLVDPLHEKSIPDLRKAFPGVHFLSVKEAPSTLSKVAGNYRGGIKYS